MKSFMSIFILFVSLTFSGCGGGGGGSSSGTDQIPLENLLGTYSHEGNQYFKTEYEWGGQVFTEESQNKVIQNFVFTTDDAYIGVTGYIYLGNGETPFSYRYIDDQGLTVQVKIKYDNDKKELMLYYQFAGLIEYQLEDGSYAVFQMSGNGSEQYIFSEDFTSYGGFYASSTEGSTPWGENNLNITDHWTGDFQGSR